MAIHTNADLDFMLQDAGVPVCLGLVSTFGIFRREDVLEGDGQGGFVTVRRRVLTIRDGTLPGLAEDATVTVAGTSYRARKPLDAEAGLVRVALVSVS